jgi:flavin-dependent dehydrogenase
MRPAGAALAKPGDALPGAALRVLRACGLPAPSQSPEHRPIGGNISAWGGPDAVRRDFLAEPDGPSWRLDRRVFEADLIAAARAAGVEARADALQDARREGEVWRLRWREGGGGTARWLIDATGRSAAVARKFGARRHFDEPLVAIVGHGRPHPRFAIEQSLVETTPDGWWYAALLPDRRPVFMLHTRPGSRVSPDLWRARLAATRHIAQAFPYVRFEDRLRGYDARGGWLAPVHGDGWIACGDAALSFDPSAAQGLFSALYLGMAAADATHAALGRAPATGRPCPPTPRNAWTYGRSTGGACKPTTPRSAAGRRRISGGREHEIANRRPTRTMPRSQRRPGAKPLACKPLQSADIRRRRRFLRA